tara:strand:- start:872 stop:5017 length:4146 start_codon:yes stop_codon:yes gene_type:complete
MTKLQDTAREFLDKEPILSERVYDPTTDTYKERPREIDVQARDPQAALNLVLGAAKAIPKIFEPERYVKTYDALEERQDKLLKEYEGKGPIGSTWRFVKNAGRDAANIAAAAFVLSDALGEAASKDPEAVSEFFAALPPTIAAATYQVLSDPIESLGTDPLGTVLTFTGVSNLAKARLGPHMANAVARAPAPMRAKFQATQDAMGRLGDTVFNKPIEELIPGNRIPLSRGEKVVGGGGKRRRMDVYHGEEALRVGDVLRGAVVPTIVGLGVGGYSGAAVGLLGSALFRGVVSAAKSSTTPNALGNVMGSFERLVKGTSRARNISEGVAKSVIMAEAAKAGSKLEAQLNKIEDAIKRGDLDSMGYLLKELETVIPTTTVTTTLRKGVYDVDPRISQRTGMIRGEVKARRLPESIQKPLDAALSLIDEVTGGRAQFAGNEINRIARLDSTMLMGAASVRRGVIKGIQKTLNRKLTNAEARVVTSKLNQMASMGRLSHKDVRGFINIGDKSIDLSRAVQAAMKTLQPKEQRRVITQAIGAVMAKEVSAVRAQSFIRAIEDSAMAPVRGKTYNGRSLEELIKEFVPLQEGRRPASARGDVLRLYAEAVAESVVIRGNTVPMAVPRGISFSQVRSVLDNQRFQQAFREKHNIQPGNRQFDQAMRGLVDSMPDGFRIGDHATINIFKRELEDLRTNVADLKKAGYKLDEADQLFLRELEDSYKIQAGSAKRLDKHNGPEVHPELAKTLDWVSNWKPDSSKGAQILNTMAGAWKYTRTVASVGTGIINNLANAMISSIENGVLFPQMYTKYADDVVQTSRFSRGAIKGFSPDELAYLKMTDELGFVKGDMTRTEIKNFIRGSDVNAVLKRGKLDGVIDEAAHWFGTNQVGNFVKEGAASVGGGARKFYSSGDTIPKRVHAKASMRESVDRIRSLEPGSYIGIRTNENVVRIIKRLDDGTWTYNNRKIDPHNLAAKGNKKLRDVLMANARRRANDRFVDFASRPGLMRAIDKWGLSGIIADPFITWGMKAKGIGGPNLFSTVMGLGRREYISNSPAVNRALAQAQAAKRLRASVILHTTRTDQASESRRKALDLLNTWASESSLGTLAAMGSEGMAYVRDLANLVSTNEATKLWEATLMTLATIFEDDKDVEMKLASKGGPDSPLWNNLMNILDTLGLATDPTAVGLITNAIKNDARSNERNFREIRKTLFGTTPDLFMDYVIGTLRDNDMLPEWADEMLPRTYFDFIHQSTPKVMRPSRLRHFFVRNSGKLLTEQAYIWSGLGKKGKPGKLQRNANRIKKHLLKIYYDPVAESGTREDAVKAWQDIRDWFNPMFIKAAKGYVDSAAVQYRWDADTKRAWNHALRNIVMADNPPLPSIERKIRQRILGQ